MFLIRSFWSCKSKKSLPSDSSSIWLYLDVIASGEISTSHTPARKIGKHNEYQFSLGITEIEFSTQNKITGEIQSCSLFVTVEDNTPPVAKSCPKGNFQKDLKKNHHGKLSEKKITNYYLIIFFIISKIRWRFLGIIRHTDPSARIKIDPRFSDNTGIEAIDIEGMPKIPIRPGEYLVTYRAKDQHGNIGVCQIAVLVTGSDPLAFRIWW